jgi:uncharacterized membrane protein YhdT
MRAEPFLKWAVLFLAPFVRDFPSTFNLTDYIVCVLFVVLVYKFIKFLFFLAHKTVDGVKHLPT